MAYYRMYRHHGISMIKLEIADIHSSSFIVIKTIFFIFFKKDFRKSKCD